MMTLENIQYTAYNFERVNSSMIIICTCYLQDIEKYANNPEEYVALEHNWFTQEEAQLQRSQTMKTLKTLFYLHTNKFKGSC